MTATDFIQHLHMLPHPEGGYFKETYRSEGLIPRSALDSGFSGDRPHSTAIYFLLQSGDYSAFHRIKSDECWHHYEGGVLLVHMIDREGEYSCIRLGKRVDRGEVFQYVVPANCWFASEPAPGEDFALVGCTVAPGFDFADFEMARHEDLLEQYPLHRSHIERLCR